MSENRPGHSGESDRPSESDPGPEGFDAPRSDGADSPGAGPDSVWADRSQNDATAPLWHAPGDTPPYGVAGSHGYAGSRPSGQDAYSGYEDRSAAGGSAPSGPGHGDGTGSTGASTGGSTGGSTGPIYGPYARFGADEQSASGARAFEQGAPGLAPAGAGPARPRRASSRVPLVVGGLAALLLVGGGTGAYLLAPATSSDQAANSASGAQRWPAGNPPVQQANASAPDWVATAAAVAPSVVSITIGSNTGQGGQGSGVILDAEGHIVTNNHVVAAGSGGGSAILVTLNDKRAYRASVVGTDPSTDLAVLKLDDAPGDLTPITMGNDSQLQVGSPVMAVGNPLGLAGTVTTGIVSALNRPVTTQAAGGGDSPLGSGGEYVVTNAIQTSAAINPGNSGGALVNSSGQLVGINSSIAQTSQDGGNIGIGFAIPVNEARSVSAQILSSGTVRHPYIGLTGRGGYVRDGDAQRAAAIIERVTPGSPAAQIGLQPGDAVVAIDDEPVDSWEGLVAQVRERDVDSQVKLTIVRNGTRQDMQATLAERQGS